MAVVAVPHEVTVCTVVRGEENLPRWLDALDQQSLPTPGFDVVIVDATAAGLQAEPAGTRRFETTVVRVDKDSTHGAALNAGWQAARGSGVGFLSADVVPAETWVEATARDLHRGRHLVSGWWQPTEATLGCAGTLSYRLWSVAREVPLASTEQLGCRRSDLAAVGGFDEELTDAVECDLDLAIRLVESGVDPVFDRWLICHYDIEPVSLSEMVAARPVGADAVRTLARRPMARNRFLRGGVVRGRAQPFALLALTGLLLMAKDRRAVLLIAPWWHERTCETPLTGGPRRKLVVLPGVLAFDLYDALLGLKARFRSS